jgi:sigma-E factor negative regulatory protein RseA
VNFPPRDESSPALPPAAAAGRESDRAQRNAAEPAMNPSPMPSDPARGATDDARDGLSGIHAGSDPGERRRAWLSALADGRPDALDPASRAFAEDAEARATWHRYQLIGDVLRSTDLARDRPGAAADFLGTLRERLAAEPAVLAPAPLPAPPVPAEDSRRALAREAPRVAAVPSARRQRWVLPLAAAAGVVAVVGMVRVSGVGLPDRGAAGASLAAAEAQGPVLRNAELDEYLRAHRLQRAAVVPMMPGAGFHQTELSGVTAGALPASAADLVRR